VGSGVAAFTRFASEGWLAELKLAYPEARLRLRLRRGSFHSLRERKLVGGERIELPTNGV
jgi:hypothetical protein